MEIFLVVLNNLFSPYWDTLRKRLGREKVAPLTITNSPNLIGHPIGIALLCAAGVFALPDHRFFLLWICLIVLSACSSVLTIWGLLKTKFFAVEVIGSLGFVANSFFAVLILGEHLKTHQVFAILFALVGVILFVWTKESIGKFTFDKGMIYILLSVLIGGLSSIFYKLATFTTPNYWTFLSGRFVTDLVIWTTVWLISLAMIKRNPITDLGNVYLKRHGQIMVAGIVLSGLVSSWLIYKMPVTTLAMLSTLGFPAAYFLSQIKYKERISFRMWMGTLFIVGGTVLFLTH
jgi:drug/metabolite transporter (DMT)-like permease